MKFDKHLVILSAMPEEIGSILENLSEIKKFEFGDLTIYRGLWKDIKNNRKILISTAWSGWGKVCASRAATRIISLSQHIFPINLLIFTGVAGALNEELNQWDLVLPTEVIQYDLDATPIFEKFVIPSLKKKFLAPIPRIHSWAFKTLKKGIKKDLKKFGNIFDGVIGTADKFISSKEDRNKIRKELPSIQAIEMEGAAVAQVLEQERVPWIIVRVISDEADNNAEQNFNTFLKEYSKISWELVKLLLINYDLD